jgi:hypothetical protein
MSNRQSKYSISPNSGRLRKKIRLHDDVPFYHRKGFNDFEFKRKLVFGIILFFMCLGIYFFVLTPEKTMTDFTKVTPKTDQNGKR